MVNHLGTVSSEGGPLLLGDALLVQAWRTVDDSGTSADYERACNALDSDGAFIAVGAGQVLVWELGGAGTADVIRKGDSEIVLSRGWFETNEPTDESIAALARLPMSDRATLLGELEIDSGTLVILWAAEDGRCVESTQVPSDGVPTGEMSMGGTGLMVAVQPGRYTCVHDDIKTAVSEVRRCHLRRVDK